MPSVMENFLPMKKKSWKRYVEADCQSGFHLDILKGLRDAYAIFKNAETSGLLQVKWIPKIMVQFCYLRLYLGTETVSCHL